MSSPIGEEAIRKTRLQVLRDANADPYPARVARTHTVEQFLNAYDVMLVGHDAVVIVGRVRTLRQHGGLTFVHVEDGSGRLQIVMKRDEMGSDAYNFFLSTVDAGDFLEVRGNAFTTRKGERSLSARAARIIAKAILPLPEKWHGLTDTEIRYRKRELDLIANASVRHIFHTRAKVIRAIREYLDARGFLEVETPILQTIPGGASARPFVTHHNVLHADMYLRVAPELYLKRLLVGGYERVFEVARCFRNEGIDHAHNPEFTQIEGYVAYMDYRELMEFLEEMVLEVIRAAGLDPSAVPLRGEMLDFTPPWPRLTFRDALQKHAHIDIEEYPDRASLWKQAASRGIPVGETSTYGNVLDELYKHTVRPTIVQPTYLIDYPAEMTPLPKRKPENARYLEMFQLICGRGIEMIKAFSELNDPIDQEARFREQDEARAKGDPEAQFTDDAYVEAMKHGMPPNAGFGIGVDRLVALLTDSPNLKEVILFPTLRPE
jgi:lysyl-tRNA synthetase class 2